MESDEKGTTASNIEYHNFQESGINLILQSIFNYTNYNVSEVLSDWQIAKLTELDSDAGIRCLLKMWLLNGQNMDEPYCNSTWDNVYCWPSAQPGEIITQRCSFIFQETHPLYAPHLKGNAIRECLDNGTWSRGFRTNYDECAQSLLEYEETLRNREKLVMMVQYMVFIGSIISLTCLGVALIIFCSFRRVWSERIKLHVHLMLSLVIRFIVFIIITEPFVLDRSSNYRDDSTTCKAVLSAYLFSTVSSVSWMLVQGMYLNGKLTTDVFASESRRKFRLYYFIGWVLPVILLVIYLAVMITNQHPEHCWRGYAEMKEIWILFVPTITALLLNCFFLCNILRIVLTKGRSTTSKSEFSRVVSIAKATLFLFPIMGLYNILILYSPEDEFETIYVSLNTFFGSTQGIFVAIVYCFNCKEVHEAIRRSYNRFAARRSVGNRTRGTSCSRSLRLRRMSRNPPQADV